MINIKTCLITGGNSGIGYSASVQIAKKGYEVVLLCRNYERAKNACEKIKRESGNEHVSFIIADLSSVGDVKQAVDKYLETHDKLDVLINNACDFDISVKKAIYTDDGLEKQFATNVVAPFLLTKLLMNAIKKSEDKKVINISSKGLCVYPNIKLDFDNLNCEKSYSASKNYYKNKLALLMSSLLIKEENKEIKVFAIRVTNVKIDMERYKNINPVLKNMYKLKSRFSISPDEMAEVYTKLATENRFNGFLYDENMNEVKANKFAYDVEAQKRLNDILEKYL